MLTLYYMKNENVSTTKINNGVARSLFLSNINMHVHSKILYNSIDINMQ